MDVASMIFALSHSDATLELVYLPSNINQRVQLRVNNC